MVYPAHGMRVRTVPLPPLPSRPILLRPPLEVSLSPSLSLTARDPPLFPFLSANPQGARFLISIESALFLSPSFFIFNIIVFVVRVSITRYPRELPRASFSFFSAHPGDLLLRFQLLTMTPLSSRILALSVVPLFFQSRFGDVPPARSLFPFKYPELVRSGAAVFPPSRGNFFFGG